MSKRDPINVIGIILIIIGAVIILSALPLIQQTAFSVGPISADIPQTSVIRIVVGFVLALLGLRIYLGKGGLRLINR